MEFKFNFLSDDTGLTPTHSDTLESSNEEKHQIGHNEATKLTVDDSHKQRTTVTSPTELTIGKTSIAYRLPTNSETQQWINNFSCGTVSDSDLIKGEYEGGLKIWEGAMDLCHYFASRELSFENKMVLEVGCGVGLPGLYAYNKGATVHFQDYNKEVLDLCTIPSVLLNTPREDWPLVESRCQFICGDWSNVDSLLQSSPNRYDVVVTSETIYESQNHSSLYKLLRTSLKSDGEIYLSAKSYYFGVGGGIEQFKQLVLDDDHFGITQCWTNDTGLRREIICMKHK